MIANPCPSVPHLLQAAIVAAGAGPTLTHSEAVLALSPLAYYRMLEASGNIADSSGNGYTGTPVGTLTYGVTGPVDGAIDFGGAGQFNLSSALANGVAAITVVAVIRTPVSHSTTTYVFAGGDYNKRLYLYLNASSELVYRIGSASDVVIATLAADTDYHLTFTCSGGVARGYVNGVELASSSGNGTSLGNSYTTIGAYRAPGVPGSSQWKSLMDEFAIWHSGLGGTDIAALAAAAGF